MAIDLEDDDQRRRARRRFPSGPYSDFVTDERNLPTTPTGSPGGPPPVDPMPGPRETPGPGPVSAVAPNLVPGNPLFNPRDAMIERDSGSWQKSISEAVQGLGGSDAFNDPGQAIKDALGDVQRQASYAQNNARDPSDFLKQALAQLKQRAGNVPGGSDNQPPPQPGPQPQPAPQPAPRSTPPPGFDRRDESGYGPGPQTFSPTAPPQFSDPITTYLEQIAQDRAKRLENPPENSGQKLLEDAIRRISAQFEQGGFTPGEQEILQTQAIDPLERLRTTRKQQVMEQLSARGITPSSGLAQQMLADVDRQFDANRATTQRNIAGQAAQERQGRMLTALQQLAGLADTENQRINEGFQYRTVPLNLADRAFGQGLQVSDRAFNRADTAFNQGLALSDRTFGRADTAFNQGLQLSDRGFARAGEVADRGFNQATVVYNAAGNPNSLISPMMQLQALEQGRGDSFQRALAELIWGITRGGQRAA